MELSDLFFQIGVASFASTGLMEWLKNFIKFKNSVWYAVLMPFVAVGCYFAMDKLPPIVIGCILTLGTVQLNYQLIVQSFKKFVESVVNKIGDK